MDVTESSGQRWTMRRAFFGCPLSIELVIIKHERKGVNCCALEPILRSLTPDGLYSTMTKNPLFNRIFPIAMVSKMRISMTIYSIGGACIKKITNIKMNFIKYLTQFRHGSIPVYFTGIFRKHPLF